MIEWSSAKPWICNVSCCNVSCFERKQAPKNKYNMYHAARCKIVKNCISEKVSPSLFYNKTGRFVCGHRRIWFHKSISKAIKVAVKQSLYFLGPIWKFSAHTFACQSRKMFFIIDYDLCFSVIPHPHQALEIP